MKVALKIEYKEGVEDPEATVVSKNAAVLGFGDLGRLKIAKEYVFEVKSAAQKKKVEELAKLLLVNPVIQSYAIETRED